MINRPLLLFIKRQLPRERRNSFDVYYVFFSFTASLSMWLMAIVMLWLEQPRIATSIWVGTFVLIGTLALWTKGLPDFWAQTIFESTLICLMIYNAWATGGVTSPCMIFLGIAPILPLFFSSSRRFVFFWLFVSLVGMLLTLTLQLNHLIPMRADQTWQDLVLSATMYAFLAYTQWSLIDAVESTNTFTLRKINRSNQRLQRLSHDLQRANSHKDQFLAIVSHEMRTPLNAVMGYLNLMDTDERTHHEAKEFVTGAQNAAAHLLTVINDLLDYSQIQNGKITLNPQTFNLHTMLHNTHGSLMPRAIDFGLSYGLYIDPQVPEWIKADQHRLTQVLINLLGNALKFTDKGYVNTQVYFEPSAKTPQSGTLCVHVIDSGPGIALAEQARIFEPFVQLTRIDTRANARDALRGNGLGLSITDTLVKSHGGQLTVRSAVGQGSTFSFRIPVHIAPAPHKPLPTLDRVDTSAFKLLIVDDHAVNRLVAKATLQRAMPNAHIEEAENGLTGFAKMSEALYDVVLLDLVMPDIDGIEVMRRVRNTLPSPLNTVHVIALTANVANEALIACKEVGMDEVMSKPFDRHTLVNRVLHYCLKNQ